MPVQQCLLDNSNTRVVRGRTVADRVISLGKQHLWNERPGALVDTVIVHCISASQRQPSRPFDKAAIIEILCDLGLSSHYLVARGGAVTRLVPEAKRAWHCGGSVMPESDNRRNVNDFSVGVELVATADSGFSLRQYHALAGICRSVAGAADRPVRILGHEHVAGARAVTMRLRDTVKSDPGEHFDWEALCTVLGAGACLAEPGILMANATK